MGGEAANSPSSTRRTLRLPRELIGEILRFFLGDERALKQYALVSQDWLLESRPFLFRRIDLHDGELLEVFVSNVLHSEGLRPWLTSIHHLSFCLGIDEGSFIVDISDRLSNLRTMTWDVRLYRPREVPSPEVLNALGRFSQLQHLELSQHSSCPSFESFKKIVMAFPALSSLTLFGALWNSARPNESPSARASGYSRLKLAKLSISAGYYGCPKEPTDDVLLWLSTTPSKYHLREFAFDVCNLAAALEMIAGRSLVVLDLQFEAEDPEPFGDNAQVVQLRRLASQVRDIELLRLHLSVRGHEAQFVSWSGVARVLRVFAAVASVRRLRLCCSCYGSYLPLDGAPAGFDLGASPTELDPVLVPSEEGDAFNRTLRTVEFAMYYPYIDKTPDEHYALCCAWVQRTLPLLHERGIAKVYAYNDNEVFGPTGLISHACEPDFPHAYPPGYL